MRLANIAVITIWTGGVALSATGQSRSATPVPENRSIVTAEAAPGRNVNAEDVQFLAEARRTALAAVQLGELAKERAQDPEVRAFGERIATEHAQHAAKIEQLMEPLRVTVPEEPSVDAEAQRAALARLSGEEFDASFVQAITWSLSDAIERYGAETHANPDRALADFARTGLEQLREQLAAAEALR